MCPEGKAEAALAIVISPASERGLWVVLAPEWTGAEARSITMAKKLVTARPSSAITSQTAKPTRTKRGVKIQPPTPETKVTATPSKSNLVLMLLKRSVGASLDDLMNATNWQPHSVRGFLSGTVRKRMGLTLISELSEQGLRRYRITGEAGA